MITNIITIIITIILTIIIIIILLLLSSLLAHDAAGAAQEVLGPRRHRQYRQPNGAPPSLATAVLTRIDESDR